MAESYVYEIILEALQQHTLKSDYQDEQKDLQPELKQLIENTLHGKGLHEYEVKKSIGGQNKPHVDLLGTNFWPDIEIAHHGKPIIAIEIKYATSLPGALSSALGQCMIYKLKYEYVMAFIVHKGPTLNSRYNEYNNAFWELVSKHGIPMIIRIKDPSDPAHPYIKI